MKTTLELLEQARRRNPELSERQLSMQLGHSDAAIAVAKKRGSLSPVLAGQLAEMVGESIEHWIAIAALESQPRSRVTDHLRRALTAARNSWLKPLAAALRSPSRHRPLGRPAPHA